MNNTESNILPETQDFIKLFHFNSKEEIVPWSDTQHIGFSIIKNYPNNISFIPAKNKKGIKDSVILIKIGYSLKESQESKENKTVLNVEIHKSSRFQFKHHYILDKADEDAPTEESLQKSESSPQPIDLAESNRYFFFPDKKKFFDSTKKRFINPNKIIKYIYQSHLDTITNIYFRMKMKSKEILISSIEPTINFLIYTNFLFFGKQIKKNRDDFSTGTFSPYKHTDLIDSITDKIKVLNSDFPITYQSARTLFTFITFIFLAFYFLEYDFFGLIKLINESNKNSLFLISLTTFALFFIDRVLPHLILSLINILIRFRLYLWNLNVNLN